jgi:hypothetical protein
MGGTFQRERVLHERAQIGVVGCGLIAQATYLPYLSGLADRFEIAAVFDLSPAAFYVPQARLTLEPPSPLMRSMPSRLISQGGEPGTADAWARDETGGRVLATAAGGTP